MIVEDDPDIAELVSRHLEKFGFTIEKCIEFHNVLKEFEKAKPHLVLLDINLPAYDGFYWCGKIREKSSCPIIFLSSRNADSDQVYAMMNGGDDYVTKPFSLDVLTAKVTAILRRTYGEYVTAVTNDLSCGDCSFSQNRLVLRCNGKETVDGKTWFWMKFVTDEPINNIDGVIAGTTYGYYDENNQCLGYAQKRLFENENLEREYYLIFMDADGNPKDYLAEEHGEELYDYEGNQIGSGKADLKGYIGEKCYFEIDTEPGVSVDAVDKMAMYLQLFSKFNETAGD